MLLLLPLCERAPARPVRACWPSGRRTARGLMARSSVAGLRSDIVARGAPAERWISRAQTAQFDASASWRCCVQRRTRSPNDTGICTDLHCLSQVQRMFRVVSKYARAWRNFADFPGDEHEPHDGPRPVSKRQRRSVLPHRMRGWWQQCHGSRCGAAGLRQPARQDDCRRHCLQDGRHGGQRRGAGSLRGHRAHRTEAHVRIAASRSLERQAPLRWRRWLRRLHSRLERRQPERPQPGLCQCQQRWRAPGKRARCFVGVERSAGRATVWQPLGAHGDGRRGGHGQERVRRGAVQVVLRRLLRRWPGSSDRRAALPGALRRHHRAGTRLQLGRFDGRVQSRCQGCCGTRRPGQCGQGRHAGQGGSQHL